MMSGWRGAALGASLLVFLLLSGCASRGQAPTASAAPEAMGLEASQVGPGQVALSHARAVLGTPYRYGGSSAENGFDCSGLVQYAYARAGVALPRTTHDQLQRLSPLPRTRLAPGDLLFFRLGDKAWHVGLYAGDGRFIHAPSSGKHVSEASLDNPYWRRHLYRGGRVY
ncbi:C40 family peptidase [Alkalilimnicola sp. S0819]|uniref:C40 family peptidase n=1 Tax=Alkalilimnicola sp. S0819 TaxID=2613922 RepID=UPI00126205C2|nr:C40 family peptidase [Alkalilimnicola sp. S0819]KAB7619569.1 NlpC/P60 family protein [Alkalilimnicola sp. S0819]MPQ17621.1 NlpC/P60 family protein [Alkalilimnicola sp. S0819]